MRYNNNTKKWESDYWHPAITTDAVVFGFDGEKLNIVLNPIRADGRYLEDL